MDPRLALKNCTVVGFGEENFKLLLLSKIQPTIICHNLCVSRKF